jgi:hypothetical protein
MIYKIKRFARADYAGLTEQQVEVIHIITQNK